MRICNNFPKLKVRKAKAHLDWLNRVIIVEKKEVPEI